MATAKLHLSVTTPLILAVWSSVILAQHRHKNPYNMHDYKDHPCIRECREGEPAKTCSYYFLVEHYTTLSAACYDCPNNATDCSLPQCVTGSGLYRPVLTVNRMVPGPAIHVCQGDQIEVVVDNRMELGEGTTIHWHGIRQKHTPFMDGTSMVTQCPITKWSKMKYSFNAADPGTYFWHSHAALQRSDGLFGSLVIRQPQARDPQASLYDLDLPEHTIMLNDWSARPSADSIVALFHTGEFAYPSGILVNGRARVDGGFPIPYEEFRVRPSLRYRFRVVYSGILNCPIYVRVDDHKLLLISADGTDFQPVEVDSFTIYSGERYDFILQTKGPEERHNSSYWMRFKGQNFCATRNIIQAAILRYDIGGNENPAGVVTYDNTVPAPGEVTVSDGSGVTSETNMQIVDLKSLDSEPEDPDLVGEPDKRVYIAIDRSKLPDDRFLTPSYPGCPPNRIDSDRGSTEQTDLYPIMTANETVKCRNPTNRYNLQLNYITGRRPPAPLLTQYEDIDQKFLCNGDNIVGDCTKKLCDCVHTLKFNTGDLVEIVLVNPRAEANGTQSAADAQDSQLVHPIHIHGYKARVVTMLRLNQDISIDDVKEMDARGEISRVKFQAPYKDTIPVGDRSVVIIRFRADNPGFWFFHCHIELHTELGMALIIQSGELSEMPHPPTDFPKCKSWEMDDVPDGRPTQRDTAHLDSDTPQAADDGCVGMGVCSDNKTHRKFVTADTALIAGVAILICVSLPALMLGTLYCLKKKWNRQEPSPYRLIRDSAESNVSSYSSLRQADETNLNLSQGE